MKKTLCKAFCICLLCYLFSQESCTTIKPDTIGPVKIEEPLGFCHAGSSRTDQEYKLQNDLGCEWMRIDYRWDDIERIPGKFDFQSMDEYTQMALHYNRKIIAVLCYDVDWIHNGKKSPHYISPEYYNAFIHYVTKTVTHYKGQVAAFEIWNEPNNKLHRFWGGSDKEFIDLFKETVKTIKGIDSTIIVTTPGFFRGDAKYLQKVFESGAMQYVDVISFHPYAVTLSGYIKQIKQVQEKARNFGFKGQYWISEMGYPTGGLYPTRVSEDNLPAKVVKTLVYGLANNINVITWYQLFDHEKRQQFNSEDFFGLVIKGKEYPYKKGAYAFRAIAQNISNSCLMNSEVECNAGRVQYYNFQHDNGTCLLVLWSERGHHKVNIFIPSEKCLQWSISSPDIKALSGSSICFDIGKDPIVLTFNNKEKPHEHIIISKVK